MGVIDQVRGFGRNVREIVSVETGYEILPPSIADTIQWFLKSIPRAFGFGTPEQMITGSVALAVVSVLSSFVTFGATLALLVVWAVTFSLGVLRLVPVVNAYWPLN